MFITAFVLAVWSFLCVVCCLRGCRDGPGESRLALWAVAWPWLSLLFCCRSKFVPLRRSLPGWQAGWHTVSPLWSCALPAFWNTDWLTTLLFNLWARADERGRLSFCPASAHWHWMTAVYSPLHSSGIHCRFTSMKETVRPHELYCSQDEKKGK